MDFKEEMKLDSKNEQCLFYDDNQEDFLFILVYVDDILVFQLVQRDLIVSVGEFEIKDVGRAKYGLGLEIDPKQGNVNKTNKLHIGLYKTTWHE